MIRIEITGDTFEEVRKDCANIAGPPIVAQSEDDGSSVFFGRDSREDALSICKVIRAYVDTMSLDIRKRLSRILVIKAVRDLTGMDLRTAKEFTETHGFPPHQPAGAPL